MWHLLIFRSSWDYLKNMTRILTTTLDKEVPLTVNTWHAVFTSWNQKTTWIFEHSFTSHACDNGNTYCFGAWLQFPKHLKTPQWLCLVYLHIYSSGSHVPFPKYTGFIQFWKWAENIMPGLRSVISVDFCKALSTEMFQTIGYFSLWGIV